VLNTLPPISLRKGDKMKYRTLKNYKKKDIQKVCSKHNPNELPSQFDAETLFKTWDRLILLKNGDWIFQSDEINEEIKEDPKNEIDALAFKLGIPFCRSDDRIYNESATISFSNRRINEKR
tara:strand:- start:483 stop:845 length:363 start_codon:yes stop_codon:yes gene_type:complete